VFDYAVRDGVIHRNPAAGIRLPKVQGNDPRPLTHHELWQLADQFDRPREVTRCRHRSGQRINAGLSTASKHILPRSLAFLCG
jgi:site-specific recombinase XerC